MHISMLMMMTTMMILMIKNITIIMILQSLVSFLHGVKSTYNVKIIKIQ